MLPAVAFPVTLNMPLVDKFAPDMLPLALIVVPANVVAEIFPAVALPVTFNVPDVAKFPLVNVSEIITLAAFIVAAFALIFPVAVIVPAVTKLPTVAAPTDVRVAP